MKTNDVLIFGLVGIGIYFAITKGAGSGSGSGSGGSIQDKRTALFNWTSSTDSAASNERWRQIVLQMTSAEIETTYNFIFNYVLKNVQVPAGSALYYSIEAISNKYQIFT